ncbi:MAG: hypothetical protein Roseis2KO_12810 [Roseivirga sp.]
MPLLLYIQVKSQDQIGFGNPYSSLAADSPNLLLLDADNYSEELVIDHQLKMLDQASQVILILDVATDSSPGKTVRLIERLLRKKGLNLSVFLKGNNAVIERMLKLSKTTVQSELSEQALYTAIGKLPDEHS